MNTEILSIGTELLMGQVANTDAQMLSRGLAELGIFVRHHSVVGDNEARIKAALAIAESRADIIITTGGLGPTYDDITRRAVADYFGRTLLPHKESLEAIEAFFKGAGRVCTSNNLRQGYFPEGAEILANERGTAPGCAFFERGKHVVMLPGPPSECTAMFEKAAKPYLARLSTGKLVSRYVRFFGIGESALEAAIHKIMEKSENPTIASYIDNGEVYLRVTARGETEEECFAETEKAVRRITMQFKRYVYGVDVASLEEAVCKKLHLRGLTLATAESCSGGLIAKRVTDLPGASEIFRGGVVAYTDEMKRSILGVRQDTLSIYGAISEQTAKEMAEGVLRLTGADYALATTGACGSDVEQDGVGMAAAGTVFCALAAKGVPCLVKEIEAGPSRERGRNAAAGHALKMLLDAIAVFPF